MPSHAELLTALYRRGHRGVELGLDRVLVGAQAVGAPHQRLRALHVAGTNGKGSTCAMLEAVALRAGLRVGLYTSPHLCRLAERVRIGGEPIAEAALDEALARVLSDAPAELTFFETLTLAAFVAFEEAALDVVVLEVGLGGRLDATNLVARPLAAGITNITVGDGGRDLEHAALLGSTSEAIAREKAGIGKRGCPLVVGAMDAAAREVILAVAEERGASPIYVCRGGEDRAALMPDGSSLALAPRLIGPHQRDNAHVAAAMASFAAPELGLGPSDIEAGIAEAVWPARFELLSIDGREVILDCAHNVEGARVARGHARGERPPPRAFAARVRSARRQGVRLDAAPARAPRARAHLHLSGRQSACGPLRADRDRAGRCRAFACCRDRARPPARSARRHRDRVWLDLSRGSGSRAPLGPSNRPSHRALTRFGIHFDNRAAAEPW
jgi:dihydrofolate synthase/folylpolyglutamate synthase